MQDEFGANDPLLLLKATPPRVPRTLLGRSRLGSTAPELADRAVVVVQAPAGFGKTSLLSQWRREALRRGAVAAWLTLDERDDGNRFVQGLVVATRMAPGQAQFGQTYLRAAAASQGELEALTNWLAEVAHLAVEFELFLDDVHALPASTLDSSLTYLLRNAPPNLRIFLGTRRPLAVAVSDLLAHGQLALLDADTLRLTHEETSAVVAARFGARADAEICARMHDLTEGWPLGLQLVISTIEKRADLRDAIVGFSVQGGDIQRYFVECLVNRLPAPLEHFLTRLADVDALHPDLCGAITGRADAAELLQALQAATPIFLGGIDSDWVRIHSLAREFLKDRFDALPADERRVTHERAARWLAQRGMHDAAARQAMKAGQEQLAYEWMAHCLYDLVIAGHANGITEWVERLPPAQIEKSPSLRLAVAWTLAMGKRNEEASRLVLPLLEDPAADARQRCESAEICASAAFFADDFDGVERVIAPWGGALAALPAMLHVAGTNQLAVVALFRGMPEKARYLYQGISADGSAVGEYTRGLMDWVIGTSYLWQGQVVLAEELLRASLARAEAQCGRRSPVAATLASALAAALWERDLTDEIAPLLANRLDVLERRSPPEAILMGYVCAARAATRKRDDRRAFDLLDGLYALGEARGLLRLCVGSLAEQIRMHALRSHPEACAALAARLDRLATPEAFERWGLLEPLVRLQVGMAHAWQAAASQDWKRALAALSSSKPLAEQLRRGRDSVQVGLLQALALKRCGEDGRELFREAASLAETLGLERILADTHPDLAGWKRRLRAGDPAAEATEPKEAMPAAPPAPRPVARANVAPTALLTPKESEVLQLLAGNLSRKQIALALDVGDETVKWHLKNLFSKLDAGNRRHLLARARMLGVLDIAGA